MVTLVFLEERFPRHQSINTCTCSLLELGYSSDKQQRNNCILIIYIYDNMHSSRSTVS